MNSPLAERMRPARLQDLCGQTHLRDLLSQSIAQRQVPSLILWGPPGVGKTTIAHIIAQSLARPFHTLSAVSSGVKDVREVIQQAKEEEGSILFIDEIHRFNKGQQDALLHAVEKGQITLIGATTENPSFEVNAALLSRCQVYVLKPLDASELRQLVDDALKRDPELSAKGLQVKEYEALTRLSGGDARKLLNLLELVSQYLPASAQGEITDAAVQEIAQTRVALYDKTGEQHYDIVSAFIKSMRGSDPNAAVYWLARMIEGGEDLRFIARRMVIFSSEDIGNANPNALLMATTTFQAIDRIGYPEARIILSQCAVYLATSIKSNASYRAIEEALDLVRRYGDLPVPLAIRNAPTDFMKGLNYGEGYQYDHSHEKNFAGQEFLPESLSGKKLYEPGQNAREEEIRKFLKERWKEKYGY